MSIIDTATIPLTAPVNLRDLGGIPVADGTVRPGFAIRADDLSTVTQESADALVGEGLRAVIDLRSGDEVAMTGRGILGGRSDVSYHHVPFMGSIGQAVDAEPGGRSSDMLDQSTYGAMYLRLYEQASAQIVTSLAIIAYSPGAVAFHCAAGQDRTGVLAASLLLVLGADHDDIVADYNRTGVNSEAIMRRIAPVMAPLMAKYGFELDDAARAATRKEFSKEPMRELIHTLVARHGDPLLPLRAAGLTDGLIARLRARGLSA